MTINKREDTDEDNRRYFYLVFSAQKTEPYPNSRGRDSLKDNHLRKKGIQISTIDALIASAAIVNDCCLYTNDRDFDYITKHSQLKLFRTQ